MRSTPIIHMPIYCYPQIYPKHLPKRIYLIMTAKCLYSPIFLSKEQDYPFNC